MEQEELWKLSNDETIIIKPADKRRAVVILSKDHYQSMINIHWMKMIAKTKPLHQQQNTEQPFKISKIAYNVFCKTWEEISKW